MDLKGVGLALAAAACFSAGALCMKSSDGLRRMLPTLLMLGLFIIGALLNALAVKRGGDLGPAYVLVVGCEAMLAFSLSTFALHERLTMMRLAAVLLVASGCVLLAAERGDGAEPADLVVTSDVTPRVTSHATSRVTSHIAPRVTSHIAPRVTSHIAPRVTSHIAPHVTSRVTSHIAP